jgi:hypothetical protein
MTAKAWGAQQRAVDEVFCQNDAVSLCLLVNRRTRTMRVVDFRAGPSNAKRAFVSAFAEREGIRKIFTVVERDEVATWLRLGFTKEGSIPGFYKRSDAFFLGCAATDVRRPHDAPSAQSETRLIAAKPASGATATSAAQDLMERTIVTAKRTLRDAGDKSAPQARVTLVPEADARRAAAAAARGGRAITSFEPFGRDVERRYFVVTARGGFELHASVESQACFGNACIELLQGPRTASEKVATSAAVGALSAQLLHEGAVSCFSLAPSDDVGLAAAFLQNGFRRTGLLSEHMIVGSDRKDAIVWSRKLANPADD